MNEATLNRRAAPRKSIRVDATLVCRDITRQVRTLDIGGDGICLLVPRPIAPGSRCTITFDLPLIQGPIRITASLRTVYSSISASDEFKIGARFEDLDPETVGTLARFAASR